jgi:O-succinylbenzoate synthase
MKFTLETYSLPFLDTKREGLIVHLEQGNKDGFGEIAPLPNWSKETLDEAKKQAFEALTHSSRKSLYPSVQFGIESAYLDLEKPVTLPPIPICTLLPAPLQNQKIAKIKVGHLAVEEAIAMIKTIPETVKLRVDVNRKWSFKQAITFCNAFSCDRFEYIEELLPHFEDYAHFISPHRIAFDETFRERSLDELLAIPNLQALIAKPTLQGGYSTYIPIVPTIKEKGVDFIISSSYESKVGIEALAKLAYRLDAIDKPLGLDTLRYFNQALTTVKWNYV